MTHIRAVAVVCALVSISMTSGADGCPKSADYPAAGIELKAKASAPGMYFLANPAEGGKNAALCWITEPDLLTGKHAQQPLR